MLASSCYLVRALAEKRERWLNPDNVDEAKLKKRTITIFKTHTRNGLSMPTPCWMRQPSQHVCGMEGDKVPIWLLKLNKKQSWEILNCLFACIIMTQKD